MENQNKQNIPDANNINNINNMMNNMNINNMNGQMNFNPNQMNFNMGNMSFNPNFMNNMYANDPMMMQYMMQMYMMMNNGQMPYMPNPNMPNPMTNPNPSPNNNMKILTVQHNDNIQQVEISPESKVEELVKKVKKQFHIQNFFKLVVNGKPLVNSMTVAENALETGTKIQVMFEENRNDEITGYVKHINIRFAYDNDNKVKKDNSELTGIAKFCYLKEIALKLSAENINKFPEEIKCILLLLKTGVIKEVEKMGEETKKLLERYRKTNILNFTNYVNNAIDANQIKNMLSYLNKDDANEIQLFKNHLCKMNSQILMFAQDFLKVIKKSVFEYSLTSLEITYRAEIDEYLKNCNKCPNKNQRILYYGTSDSNIRQIIKNHFDPFPQNLFGNGYYFTNSLDCGIMMNKYFEDNSLDIPEVNEAFSFAISSVFYNNSTRKNVTDNNYSPKKNEANIALVDGKMKSMINIDKSRYYSREYVLGDKSQILPFIHIKVKRNEYCVIWRDVNFSSKDVYGDKYDKIFKDFLKERLDYISRYAKFNIYPCETTKEALDLVEKKKFNKIILMSNVGSDFGGRDFVDKARKIIGNDVICLFLAYMEEHLQWIVNYKNSLFSNDTEFYEQYLECFTDDIETTKKNVIALKNSIEDYYSVKFKIEDNFLDYPKYKNDGEFGDLKF